MKKKMATFLNSIKAQLAPKTPPKALNIAPKKEELVKETEWIRVKSREKRKFNTSSNISQEDTAETSTIRQKQT